MAERIVSIEALLFAIDVIALSKTIPLRNKKLTLP
jgi:hypothetical protein